MTETESRPRNRALVASFLFTDLVGYSKGAASEQYAVKAALSETLGKHLAALRKDDYRIKDIFHVIFFRNVMIYFERPTQQAVIRRICRNLVTGGYLFVGHSESLAGLDVPVSMVQTSIYRKALPA